MEAERLTEPSTTGPGIQSPTDLATIVTIALVVYTSSSVLHEALGHGLTCVLFGGKVALIASTVCIPAGDPLGQSATRIVAAAGSAINLISAAAASFGGTAGLAWLSVMASRLKREASVPPVVLARNG